MHLQTKTLVKKINSYIEKTHGGEASQPNFDCVPQSTASLGFFLICFALITLVPGIKIRELCEPTENQQHVQDKFKYLFANSKSDEDIYPVTVSETADC